MSGTAAAAFGTGPLSRACALVHTLLTVEVLLLATVAPGAAGLLFLGGAPANLPLAALCLLPLGPALTAALYALHHRSRDLTELRPARTYLRGLRLTYASALRIWLPLLAWLTVIAYSLTHFAASGLPGWWAGLLGLIGVGAALWGANCLVLLALFTFRTSDTARLAAYFMVRRGGATAGALSALIVAGAATVWFTEAVALLLAPLLLLSLLRTSRPMIAETEEDFTA
ncbi:DUF624 domain-containing protein [Streptomyces sp. TRM66268-LWL]|uniref:DUF624 domain-containing protein n=1 Tax=Streptomyces polyasparticus TaxID=2767826 RepID=A0ABR7SEN0_9ACTN|nr:DUF624 domain-containing protein [Streptomyces polyasparticus]MBC9712783.1 DUF624 domain-containing protein [Streptomyces polyasparticus]